MKFFDLIFPSRCAFCGAVISRSEDGYCDECSSKIPWIDVDICRICGVEKNLCECKKRVYHCTRRIAPFYYSGVARRGIVRFKKYGHFGGIEALAGFVSDRIKQEYAGIKFDMVLCVPSSKSSVKKRGFKQTELLACEIAKNCGIPFYKNILVSVYDTAQQKGLSKLERIGNVAGAYDVSAPSFAENKTILLIDDVITTGSTINECAKMLRIYGAKHVYGAAVCIANKKYKNNAK